MTKTVLALLAVVAFYDFGSEAFSNPALALLHAVKAPAVRLSQTVLRRPSGQMAISMNGKKDHSVDRRSALVSLVFLGAGALFNPKTANSAGAPLSAKEAEEYATLLQEVVNVANIFENNY